MKHEAYRPVNMAEQHEKNRILAQMEADAYWKLKMEQQDAARLVAPPFDPLAFRFKISRYARRHHTTKHELVRMSEYCKCLMKQTKNFQAKLRVFRGKAS